MRRKQIRAVPLGCPFDFIGKVFILIFVFIILTNIRVSATSWVELKPQEVLVRAEVIIIGQYDFSTKPKQSDFVFHGIDFIVKSVIKGEIPNTVTAGIDQFDVGWADEFQEAGGEFVLFLEKKEEADFLTPVGGPNGMVQLEDGKVVNHHNEESKVFYESFLTNARPKDAVVASNVAIASSLEVPDSSSNLGLYVGASVAAGIIGLIILLRYLRR